MTYDPAKYAELCIASSYAPIKPDFLQDKENFQPYLKACHDSKDETHEDKPQQNDQPMRQHSSVRVRGQNKKRRLNTLTASRCKEAQICSRLAAIGHCDFEKCRREHDIKQRYSDLLQAKNTDKEPTSVLQEVLGAACPLYQLTGLCPMGINCTINALQHVNEQGLNVKRDGSLVTDQDLKNQQTHMVKNHSQNIISIGKSLNLSRFRPDKRRSPAVAKEDSSSQNPANRLLMDDDDVEPENAHAQGTGEGANVPEGEAAAVGAPEGQQQSDPSVGCGENELEMQVENKNVRAAPSEEQSKSSVGVGPVIEKEKASVPAKRERIKSLLKGKVILAPLTTVGNLPFRRLCVKQGCEVTVSEMVLASGFCQFKPSDIALVKRHKDERIFGVQIAGGFPDQCSNAARIVEASVDCDWVDLNMGCPLDGIHGKGAGCVLMTREKKLEDIIKGMTSILSCPLTVKCRTAYMSKEGEMTIASLFPKMYEWGASGFTLHGRTARQRYLKTANWNNIAECRQVIPDDTLYIGNGDLFDPKGIAKTWEESQVDSVMIGRGALIKPWIFQEIKKGELIDISASERFDLLKDFCRFGLEHWGCDSRGVETTRRFLLEHLSFACRYIPVGLLDVLPQRHNWRPRLYFGRNDLETLMSKSDSNSWIKLSEMLLGPVPEGFTFVPKHKSSAYEEP